MIELHFTRVRTMIPPEVSAIMQTLDFSKILKLSYSVKNLKITISLSFNILAIPKRHGSTLNFYTLSITIMITTEEERDFVTCGLINSCQSFTSHKCYVSVILIATSTPTYLSLPIACISSLVTVCHCKIN